jgi:cystathionine beta-lyase/cystathionine gamma-synthase
VAARGRLRVARGGVASRDVPVSAAEQSELQALVERELGRLKAFLHSLGDAPLHDVARHDAERAEGGLFALLDWARSTTAPLELPARAAYAFRRAVNARTSLQRHTPALEGAPRSLDPAQAAGGVHLVDYARGGYFLYADATFDQGVRFEDHPRLASLARSISTTLGRGLPALLFTSGMGAINTVMDFAAEQAARDGRRLLLGSHAWIEVQEYADHSWRGRFEPVDEGDTEALARAMADPAVGALVLEPLVNHPRSPVVDLAALFRAPVAGTKLLVLDLALTPELDLSAYLRALPRGVTLALVTSGVKYFQAGWDLSKSGLVELAFDVATPPARDPYRALITLRGRSGRVLSPEEAELADLETPATLRSRLARLDDNTRRLALGLDGALRAGGLGRVVSPWLPSHPHHARALALGTGGRFVYLEFDPARVTPARLESLDRELARRAVERGLPLIVATTFGLALPHVCLLAHPVEGFRLRLSPGSGDGAVVDGLVDLVAAL